MPSVTGIIDTISTPPLASLQPVLDLNGPYSAGDYTLSQFSTNGAFLLPGGTYDIGGTYGVIVQASIAPIAAGRELGWNDAAFSVISGDYYYDRIAQLCLIHQLPLTGAYIITNTFDIHLPSQAELFPVYIGSASKIGLHVTPNWSVDLFYFCVL